VVDDGRTGIVVDDWREMTRVLEAADELDPRVMRRAVEERFAPARMVADYVAVYEQALGA
jgi:glycosyltransferase involved in cell wall biosynthesis